MRALNFLDIPSRMNELWRWVCAIDSWDYCDPGTLAELLREEELPPEFREAISRIISGKRKQKRRAASKLKIPANERMKVAGSLSAILGLIDTIRFDSVGEIGSAEKGVYQIADSKGVEPIEVRKELEYEYRKTICDVAKDSNVSEETIENLLRDMREKIIKWPDV